MKYLINRWVLPATVFFAFGLLSLCVAAESPEKDRDSTPAVSQRFVEEGIAIDFSIEPAPGQERPEGLVEGQDVSVRFRITDTATGTPLTGLRPGGWMDPRRGTSLNSDDDCQDAVKAFISTAMGNRAELDLNVYYVLSLNTDPSISVVDPLFGFGGSKLLALVLLESPGEDWTLNRDGSRLFVTMPAAGKVAVVDTVTWKIIKNIEVGSRPMRVVRQPDNKYVWIALEGASGDAPGDGVAVVNTENLEIAATIPTGAGRHEIAFSGDSRHAYITNRDSGTLSVIDVQRLEKIKDVQVGRHPASVAYSNLSGAAYVTSQKDGSITVVDGRDQKIRQTITAEPGLTAIRFAPGDRLGFILNSKENTVHILDASTSRIVQTGDVGKEPDQVTFTDNIAYVRSRGSELILMIPLAVIGQEDQPIPVIDFTGGQNPVGRAKKLSIADGIVPSPEGDAVLVANPVDKVIYYYKEGMAAPMGSFQNYGREPRAVLVVDRSLREHQRGEYSTDVRLTKKGIYDVAFFLDSPRIIHCFQFAVKPDPTRPEETKMAIRIEPVLENRIVPVGEAFRMEFRVTDAAADRVLSDLGDLEVLAFSSSGTWQRRFWARPTDESTYEVTFTPPTPGLYSVFFRSPSLKLKYRDLRALTFRARDAVTENLKSASTGL